MIAGIIENDEEYAAFAAEELKSVPGIESVLHWSSAEECLEDKNRGQAGIFFVDIGLPRLSGSDLVHLLSRKHPEAIIIVITALQSDETIFRCIRAGAVGYLLKSEKFRFKDIVENVLTGGAVITPVIAARILAQLRPSGKTPRDSLTPRETQVMDLIVNGYTAQEIAESLGTQEGTVRNQIKSIYRKLQVSSRVELMRKARDFGLLGF